MPQVCKFTKAYVGTTIGVDLESGWVGSRDVPDPSWIGAWRERDYCHLELFEAAITQLIGSNTKCAMRVSMVGSSFPMHCIAPRFSAPFNWQTISKWFCLPYALHVWPHAGHICGLSPDPATPCW